MPDRHESKSRYTLDRQIPGAFEGETVTRRRLMTGAAHGAGAIAASAFLLPALGFAICFAIWASLRVPVLIAGGIWILAGIIYDFYKTRGFRRSIEFAEAPLE